MSARYLAVSAVGALAATPGVAEDTCIVGRPSNCQRDISSHLGETSQPHSCIRFTDLPGDCTLTLSVQSKSECLLPFSPDLAVSVARNGEDEQHIKTGDSPELEWNLPVGYNELVLRNNHAQWPSSCQVDLPDISYCCVPREASAVQDSPLLEDTKSNDSASKAQLRERLHVAQKTEERLVGESEQIQEKLHATNSKLRGTRQLLYRRLADLDFYQTMAAVLLWAFVLFSACYYLMPEFRRLCLQRGQRRAREQGLLTTPLLEEKDSSRTEVKNEAGPSDGAKPNEQEEQTASFDPPVQVVDYVNDLGEEIRCIRVEVPGRRMADGARSVSGFVDVEPLSELCGTRVHLRFSKEVDMPSGAAAVSARKGSDGSEFSSTTASEGGRARVNSTASATSSEGVWEKTLTFNDGFWQPLSHNTSNEELDKHGVWQLQLARTSMLESCSVNVPASSSAARCEVYEIAGSSVCSVEWLESASVRDLQPQEELLNASINDHHDEVQVPASPAQSSLLQGGAPSESCDGASSFDKCSEVSVPVFGLEEDCGHSVAESETGRGK